MNLTVSTMSEWLCWHCRAIGVPLMFQKTDQPDVYKCGHCGLNSPVQKGMHLEFGGAEVRSDEALAQFFGISESLPVMPQNQSPTKRNGNPMMLVAQKSQCPKWEQFINTLAEGEPSEVETLRKFCKTLLMGSAEPIGFYIYGPEATGKSLLMKALQQVIGGRLVARPWEEVYPEGLKRINALGVIITDDRRKGLTKSLLKRLHPVIPVLVSNVPPEAFDSQQIQVICLQNQIPVAERQHWDVMLSQFKAEHAGIRQWIQSR